MGTIRFLLAICVVTAHIPFQSFRFFLPEMAVRSFYVISGFYMALILNEKYSSYSSFLINRFLRLYPIYWLILFITFIVVLFSRNFIPTGSWGILNTSSHIILILTNLLIVGQDIMSFVGYNIQNGSFFFTANPHPIYHPLSPIMLDGVAWSISLELTFYLTAPFLVKRKPWLIVLVILLSALLRMVMGAVGLSHKDDAYSRFFFPFELMYFCLGILAYKIYAHIKKSDQYASIAVALYCFSVAYCIGFQHVPEPFCKGNTFLYPFWLMVTIPFIFLHFKSKKWDQFIGDLSYPIYICHLLIINLIKIYIYPFLPAFGQEIAWVLVIIAVIFLSIMLLKFVQEPIDRYRHSKVV